MNLLPDDLEGIIEVVCADDVKVIRYTTGLIRAFNHGLLTAEAETELFVSEDLFTLVHQLAGEWDGVQHPIRHINKRFE